MAASNKPNFKKMSWQVASCSLMSMAGFSVIQSYGAYIFTDLAGIPYTTTSMCMFIISILGAIVCIFAGAQVQHTKTKFGQYRPWIMAGYLVILLGGALMFTKFQSPVLTIVVVSIGYALPNLILNYTGTAEYGLLLNMSSGDSDARGLLFSRYWAGANACTMIVGIILVPLITFFSFAGERQGYLLTHVLFGVLAVIGGMRFANYGKKYDGDNRRSASVVEEEKASLGDMVKSVVVNRPAAMVVLADIFRFTGFYVMYTLMAYQCQYVIGDMMALSYYLTASSVAAVLGNLLAPMAIEKIGGRKKAAIIFNILTGFGWLLICLLGRTTWGFVAAGAIAYFFMSFQDSIDQAMYGDAGEYYLHKTGKDTRAFLLSMYSLAVKIGIALSSLALGIVLGLINYEPGMTMTAHSSNLLTIATGLTPAICYFVPVILLLIHGVSDKEIAVCIKENAEKYGTEEE